MASPPRTVYRDLPFAPVSYWDTVGMVRKALDELERGMFRASAHLADAMLRDDRVAGVLATRVNGLLSQPLDFLPPSGDEAQEAEKDVAEDVENLWSRMVPEADLEDLLKWGILLNCGLGELIWTTSSGQWVPRLKTWHPSQVYWRWDTRTYWVNTESGPVEIANPLSGARDAKWVIFTPYGYERGWMRGAVRALALAWLVRSFVRRDWARFSEVHGAGVKVGRVPIGAPPEERQKWISALATLGANPVLEAPELPDGTKFDLELVEAKAENWQGFAKLLEHADTAIAVCLLGQNLTTEVQGGSRAAAQVHDRVRKDFQQADNRKLGGALREQMLRPYARYNAGHEDLAPRPEWQTEPPEDASTRNTALASLGTFLTAASNAGAPVDTRALLEEQGVPLLSPEEEAEQAAPPEPPDPADEEKPAGDQPGEPDDAGEQAKLSGKQGLPPGARRGQAYVDRLAELAIHQAAQTLEVDLAELRAHVDAATSPADLRHRLVKAYRGMELAQLALLVDRAQVLAELAGRQSVIEDA